VKPVQASKVTMRFSLYDNNCNSSRRRAIVENLASFEEASTAVNVTVRKKSRPREYLTEREIEKLMDAARGNRWDHRDATAILIAYRHGQRACCVALGRYRLHHRTNARA
jgi:integrase